MRISIKGGHVVDPANRIDEIQSLYIADGRIVALGDPPDGFSSDRTIDASNQVVCPGLVDLCARLREPGLEHKATIASEVGAATSAGITTLCCPPDTEPVIDTPAVVELIRQRAEAIGKTNVLVLGALTRGLQGSQLSEMAALREAGCVGISNSQHPIGNSLIMRRAMEYAATHDLTMFIHPEDPWLRNNGCAHEGPVSTRLGLPGIPASAETSAVARDLVLIEQTGVRAHFCRISTARTVRMIARAQHDGLPVSADVAAHHLHLTDLDIVQFDACCHVHPPLRSAQDRDGLRDGVRQGVIAAVCSDHQPHEADAKLAPFGATEAGISALETLLPLTLRLVDDKMLSLSEAIASLTSQPAAILGSDAGTLGAGTRADVCIFDPAQEWRLVEENLVSRGHNTPFLGWLLKGRVTHTLVAGRIVLEPEPSTGQRIRDAG